jgi:acetyltransferase-like isoleucine patch superfamily enzyme
LRFSGRGTLGRISTRLAGLAAPPFYGRVLLAGLSPRGYIAPSAVLHHPDLHLGSHICIDERVLIFQDSNGGPVRLGDHVHLWRDTIVQTGEAGSLTLEDHTHIQPRCQFSAYKAEIHIGKGVEIAPHCAFYSYDHGVAPDRPINAQPLQTKGAIIVEDDVWLGVAVVVLSGVRIGKGAVIGAGSVVTRDIPDGAIAVGSPARVVAQRSAIARI